MPTIVLIRHSESQANAGSRTTDPAAIPLTEQGHRQAAQIAPLLVAAAPDLIVTSSYLRTQETAAPTRALLPHVACKIWPVHEFTYLSPLHCTQSTAAERMPLINAYWERCDPHFVDGPGAESWAELVERAEAVCVHLEQAQQRQIVIFSHGQFIQMLLAIALGPRLRLDIASMRAWRTWMLRQSIANAEIIRLAYAPHAGWQREKTP